MRSVKLLQAEQWRSGKLLFDLVSASAHIGAGETISGLFTHMAAHSSQDEGER